MVIAARRAYRDAVRWTRDSKPHVDVPATARGMLSVAFLTGIVVLGLIGLTNPSTYEGSRSGWQWFALAGLVGLALLVLGFRWRRWLRPVLYRTRELDAVEAAADALRSCPSTFRTRYSMTWIWIPAVVGVLATILAFSSAYFLVDAVLARFSVGPEQALLGVGELLAALVIFWIIASKLWGIRFAREAVSLASETY
jgi:hypothetical protein